MKRLITLLLILIPFISISQSLDSRVLVRNAGIVNGKQTISVKWYTKDLYYPEGVNIYRKEEKGEWQKLDVKPMKRLDTIPSVEYSKDNELDFFVPFIKNAKKEDLAGFFMINVLVKSFQSEVFSQFLGIQYADTAIKVGKTYTYKINRIIGNSETLLGESSSIVAGAETIEEPIKDISLKVDTLKVKMKWKVEEQRYYAVNIYKETETKDWKKLNDLPVMISKFKDSLGRYQYPEVFFLQDSLKLGFYTYQLAGVDFFGKETKRSESFKVEVKDLIPPPAPEDLKDSINNLDVTLSWKNKPATDMAGINVYRSSKSDGPFKKLNTTLLPISTVSFRDKVEKAGPYYYYVSSVDASGNEGKSHPVYSEVHDIVPPAKVLGLIAKADTGKVVLTWQKNKEGDLAGYRIYRTVNKNDKNNFALMNTNPIKENSFIDILPKNAKNKFLYKVVAMDSSFNKGESSEVVSAQMPDIMPPVKPYIKSLRNIESSIFIEWLPNKDADLAGYEIYRASGKEPYRKVNKQPIKANEVSFQDKNADYLKKYSYYIVALDSAGNKSRPSSSWTGQNTTSSNITVKSVKLKYNPKKKEVGIKWEYEVKEGFLGYAVFRKENEGSFYSISEKLTKPQFEDKGVKEGTIYQYEIRVYDKGGNIIKSEPVTIKL